MTTVTFEVPDELAAQFSADPSALPKLIREAVQTKLASSKQSGASSPRSLDREITEFLAASPALEQVAAFKISAPAQERLEELLDRNGEAELTPEEQAELEKYLQYRHVMVLLKAAARRVLGQQPA